MRSNFCGAPASKGFVSEEEDAEITLVEETISG